jgi:deoxycytidine triphosphate deaminase
VSSPPFEDYPDFAKTDEEAALRFEMAKSIDPFPEIQPSLLNSADINDYVRTTGMLHPFNVKKLKSASYEAGIRGRCIWWDDSGKQHDVWLEEGRDEELTLGPNSITFVQVDSFFRLPDYIGLRFNLKITHVHRGILLGTGPLVDPGFVGRLLIPLHNLTPNTYRFGRGEGLIWVEFTKTSELPTGGRSVRVTKNELGLSRRGEYISFPRSKWNIQPLDYLRKASPQSSVRSSIPEAVLRSRDQAETATRTVKWLTGFGFAGLVVLAITTWALIQDTWRVADDVRHQLMQGASGEREQTNKIEELQKRLQSIDKGMTDKIFTLQEQIDKVKVGVNEVRTKPVPVKGQVKQGTSSK